MRSYRYPAAILCACVLLVLTACGQETPEVAPTLNVTLPAPPGELIYVAGCAASDLENWLENTDFLAAEFVRVVTESASQPPQDLPATMERLIQLRNALVALPAPDECAAEVHQTIASMMASSLDAVQSYANGETVQMQTVVGNANAALSDIRTTQDALRVQLQAQFDAQQNSSSGG